MANFPIPDEPIFDNVMRMLETTDPAHADVFNELFQKLISNLEYLKQFKPDPEDIPKGIIKSETAPADTDALWIDTGNGGIPKYFNSEAWVAVAAVWT